MTAADRPGAATGGAGDGRHDSRHDGQRDGRIAVLDIGKTNVKLSVCTPAGAVLESRSAPNTVLPGPPWRHHDLTELGGWVMAALAGLCRIHPVERIIFSGHGSGGVLVSDDPDGPDGGAALPMIDYEQALPAGLDAAYLPLSGDFLDRGSATMMAATHLARQMFWMETARPAAFARAHRMLCLPQYWAWRLSGAAVADYSSLGAQSHLWNVFNRDFAAIVRARGWSRLMPPPAHAWDDLGPVRPALAARHGLPAGLRVHAGAHDSSCNFYRYQAAGLREVTVVSTGTWIVALADGIDAARLVEARGMTLNADMWGRPVGGALTMGGREYTAVAGAQPAGATADPAVIARLLARGTMALPAFGQSDGQFPGAAGRGRIIGPPPVDAAERQALAVLYVALLTLACIDTLDPGRPVILDGSFVRDPAFAAIVAALRPGRSTRFSPEGYGTAAGAALLCGHPRDVPAPVSLQVPPAVPYAAALLPYAARWQALAASHHERNPERT